MWKRELFIEGIRRKWRNYRIRILRRPICQRVFLEHRRFRCSRIKPWKSR